MPIQKHTPSSRILWFALAAILLLAVIGAGVFYYQSGHLQLDGILQSNLRPLASEYGGRVTQVDARPGLRVSQGTVLVRFDETALRSALFKEEQQLQALAMLVPPSLVRVPGIGGGDESLTERLERQRLVEETATRRLQEATDQEAQAAILYSRASMLVTQGKLSKQELESAEAHLAAARKQVRDARQIFETFSLERAATGVEIQRMRDMQTLVGADRLSEGERLQHFEAQEARVADLRAALAAAVIVAPTDGVIIDVAVYPGDSIAPMQPCLLFRPDGQAARVRTLAPQREAARLRAGQPARIHLNTPEAMDLNGFVSAVTPGLPAGAASGAKNEDSLAAVWIDILPQPGDDAGRSLSQKDIPAKVTVLLRAPLINPLPSAGMSTRGTGPLPGTPSTGGPNTGNMAAPPAPPVAGAMSLPTLEPLPAPPKLPPMQAPRQLTGTAQPNPNNNPSVVPPHLLNPPEGHAKP